MVLLAALTSSISLMETVCSIVMDKTKIGRKTCCLAVLLFSLLLGLPSILGYSIWSDVTILGMQFLDFFDFISNSILMPIVALLTCVLIGYVIKPQSLIEEISLTGKFRQKVLFTVMIKYVAPLFLLLILGSSVLNALGIIKI